MLSKCRFCGEFLSQTFADLGLSPLSNAYVRTAQLNQGEIFYPLHARICSNCKLVQIDEYEHVENIFNNEYAYFSSYSDSWLDHARQYTEEVIARFGLTGNSQVVEVASNDGYLLNNFMKAGIPALGIEPARNTADVAIKKGIPTWIKFFGKETASDLTASGYAADLLIGNNVLAHAPNINDFVAGLKVALKPNGVITLEFPHLLNLIRFHQFDTLYHEHFFYFSLLTLERIFSHHKLRIFDVQEIPTHGGSLRIFVQHAENNWTPQPGLYHVREKEIAANLNSLETYADFANRMYETKSALQRFLIDSRDQGLRVVGYGAPAKGNTLLNYCGIRADLIPFTVDVNPHKQGTWLPGSRIPVCAPKKIIEYKPDIVLILPWNLKDEIISAHRYIFDWGGRFAVPIPRVEFVS